MGKTHSFKEFQKIARDFAVSLSPLPDRATVVGLFGDLGAGKTTFVQAAAKSLGVSTHISSPTFLIMKSYKLLALRFEFLIHIDAYRLKDSDELRKLHFDELLADPCNLIFVEWADRVADILPLDAQKILFEFIDEETRRISF